MLTKGRLVEADKIIHNMAKVNRKDLPEEYLEGLELEDTMVLITRYNGIDYPKGYLAWSGSAASNVKPTFSKRQFCKKSAI